MHYDFATLFIIALIAFFVGLPLIVVLAGAILFVFFAPDNDNWS